jgi:hypothetical protein
MDERHFDRDWPPLSAAVGIGFKPEHAADALAGGHGLGFFEVHASGKTTGIGTLMRRLGLGLIAGSLLLFLVGLALAVSAI